MKYLILSMLLSSCCIHFHEKEKVVERACPPCEGYTPFPSLLPQYWQSGLKYDSSLKEYLMTGNGLIIPGTGWITNIDTLK